MAHGHSIASAMLCKGPSPPTEFKLSRNQLLFSSQHEKGSCPQKGASGGLNRKLPWTYPIFTPMHYAYFIGEDPFLVLV